MMNEMIKPKKSKLKKAGKIGKYTTAAALLGLAAFGSYNLVNKYMPKETQNKVIKQLNVNAKGTIDYFKDVIRKRPALYDAQGNKAVLEEKLGDGSTRKYFDYDKDGVLDEVITNDKDYGLIKVNSNYKGFDKLQAKYDFRKGIGDSRARKKISWAMRK